MIPNPIHTLPESPACPAMALRTKTHAKNLTRLLPYAPLLLCTSGAIDEKEAESLLRWKSTLRPANNGEKPSPSTPLPTWSPTLPTCSWSGIKCDAAGRVAGLILPSAGLHGTLDALDLMGGFPLVLKRCTSLMILDLGENKFSGTIPSWIGSSHPWLRILRLRSNMFLGSIPWQLRITALFPTTAGSGRQ